MKKVWITPELIILARRKSDEIILADCKGSMGDHAAQFQGCVKFKPGDTMPLDYDTYQCIVGECSFTG